MPPIISVNVRRGIENEIARRYRQVIPAVKKVIKQRMDEELSTAWDNNDTVNALLGGQLQHEIGLSDPLTSLNAIKNKLMRTLKINASTRESTLNIRVEGLRNDFEELLSIGAAEQDRTDARDSAITGPPLQWLEWLLLEGNNVIVLDHFVKNVGGGIGRSGGGLIMVPREASFWRVPPTYQGDITSNFILDIIEVALERFRSNIWDYVRPVMIRVLGS